MNVKRDEPIPDLDEDVDLEAIEATKRLHDTLASYQCSLEPEEDEDDPHARERRNPDADEFFVSQRSGKVQQLLADLSLAEDYELHKHLAIMPRCVEVMKKQRGDAPEDGRGSRRPLENTNVITIHHLDDKAYGAHAVLREWGATDMTAIFVGYNQLMNEIYRPQLNDIPDEQFRTCILTGHRGAGTSMFAEKTYCMVRDFSKFPPDEALPDDELDRAFLQGGTGGRRLTYIQAMRCLSVFVYLRSVKRCIDAGKRLLIFEDSGYLHPIINQACLDGLTVAEFRERHHAPADPGTDRTLGSTRRLHAALEGVFVGSTEMTRNGFNRDVRVQRDKGHGRLAFPLFSIACSRFKTDVESDTIAVSCLNAVAAVLYSLGVSVKHRTVVLLGARGNIGRFFARHVADILADPARQLMCCDVKVRLPPPAEGEVPPWADPPDEPIKLWREDGSGHIQPVTVTEVASFKDLNTEDRKRVDLIFGLTGGTTQVGRPTVQGDDLEDWLIDGERQTLYLASGSTKTAEFSDVLRWLDELLSKQRDRRVVTIRGRRVISIEPETIRDSLAEAALREAVRAANTAAPGRSLGASELLEGFRRSFGTSFSFTIEGETPAAAPITKKVCLLYKTYPINFMFYGTLAEILDQSYAQLLDVTAMLAIRASELSTAEVFATDYKVEATEGVVEATRLGRDYPVPDPAGYPLSAGRTAATTPEHDADRAPAGAV